MKLIKLAFAALGALILVGCAHPLQITPNIAKIERPADAKPKIKANAGFYVNAALRNEEKITPGGGGDKVQTTPYRDLEIGFYKMLTNVFENVSTLDNARDHDAITKKQIRYVISPTVAPNSSSSSMLTWPPTFFSIDLTCEILDADGKLIDTKRVVGKGQAEFSEFKNDFALAGRLAMEDALLQMQRLLLDLSPAGNTSGAVAPAK
jgi:hypothetical protein